MARAAEVTVSLPLDWKPRDYQLRAWQKLENGTKRMVLVWHRRAGKDLFAINWIATQIFQRIGTYWHVLPTYRQGRSIVWEGLTRDGRPFLDHLPDTRNPGRGKLCVRRRDDLMQLWFANGSTYTVVGADQPDRLVGANPVGIIFSEWSLMDPSAWNYLRPILAENGGWALFIFTPRGRNHAYRTFRTATEQPDWFSELLTVDDTKAVPMEAIEADRRSGMAAAMIQQEYYCSFDAPLEGSYYGDLMTMLLEQKRFGQQPYDPMLPVITAWDLGVRDETAIWFAQQDGRAVRLIDYYHGAGRGMDFYAKLIHEKPYSYREHLAPHDIKQREVFSGKSVLEQASGLGMRMRAVPKLPLQEGIMATRALLPRCYFDEEKCEHGLEALRQYSKRILEVEQGPERETVYADLPLHNWASNPADALRTLAVGLRPDKKTEFQQPAARWVV